jgi:hypothetical protein
MINSELVIELHDLARRVEAAGYAHIAKNLRSDADQLAISIEKTKINKIKERVDGQYSRFNQ